MAHEHDEDHLRRFGALRDAAELSESEPMTASNRVAASRLIAYAQRQDAISDFRIEGALRQNPTARQIYDQALRRRLLARSDMAMAAAGGTSISRKVGAYRVELIEEAEAVYLVIYLDTGAATPAAIEVRDTEGAGARLALGAPIGGIIQLRLDLSKPEPQQLRAALARTDSSISFL